MTVKYNAQPITSKLKKGDSVIVVAGSRRGHIGEIEQVLTDGRFHVSGVVSKKNVKPNPQRNVEGGIVDKLMPIDPSNVAIYNRVTKKGDRVAFKILADGKKVRIYKRTQEMIDV
jgi:large subunit ribosomal protein L24